MYIDWDESLETGVEVIDKQHKKLVELINGLYDASKIKDLDVIREIVDELVHYTLTHFSFEEDIMEHSGYLHFESHREVHRSFTKRISDYRMRLISGEDVSSKLLSELRIWLSNHIKNEDKNYSKDVLYHLHGGDNKGMLGAMVKRILGHSPENTGNKWGQSKFKFKGNNT